MRLRWVTAALALGLSACGASAPPPAPAPPAVPYSKDDASLELHAHLFMKEGMGFVVSGDFDGPLHAKDWRSPFGSQANPETVERSGIGVMVVAFYAHPLLTLSRREAVRRQLARTERFVKQHPEWVIARSAEEARAAFENGKRVMVLALEHAYGVLETDADIEEFIDRAGIRIVTFIHLIDDRYGGAAFLPGAHVIMNPWARLAHSEPPEHAPGSEGVRVNKRGLTDRGREMARKLIDHGVWLDLSHASDASSRELVAMHEELGLPLLYTHTTLRKHLGAERGIAAWELEAVGRTHGIVGLLPSDDFLGSGPLPAGTCPAACTEACKGGVFALAEHYREVSAVLPPEAIALGSDYNGGVKHLHPMCTVGTELDRAGLWNIGQAGGVWASLEKLHAPVPQPRRKVVDYFFDTWARATRKRAR